MYPSPTPYRPTPRTVELVNKAFVLQKPSEEQGLRLDAIRANAKTYAEFLIVTCPESPELTTALRNLHLASQAAVTAVLFNEPRGE